MWNNDTPLWMLTVGQFTDLLNSLTTNGSSQAVQVEDCTDTERYSYGLSGLASLLGCSKTTAWKIKDSGIIDRGIRQIGRKIIIDNEKVLELINAKKR